MFLCLPAIMLKRMTRRNRGMTIQRDNSSREAGGVGKRIVKWLSTGVIVLVIMLLISANHIFHSTAQLGGQSANQPSLATTSEMDDLFAPLSLAETNSILHLAQHRLACAFFSTPTAVPLDALFHNYLWMIALQPPLKRDAMKLKEVSRTPADPHHTASGRGVYRKAKLVVFHGNASQPQVKEWIVTFAPSGVQLSLGEVIPFYKRPRNIPEAHLVNREVIQKFCRQFFSFLMTFIQPVPCSRSETARSNIRNCSCLAVEFSFATPLVFEGWGDYKERRRTWYRFHHAKSVPFIQNPLSLQILVDHTTRSTQDWRVTYVWLEGQIFTLRQFQTHIAHHKPGKRGPLKRLDTPIPSENIDFTHAKYGFHPPQPAVSTPIWREGQRLHFGQWHMLLTVFPTTGIRFYDVHFGSTFVAYEVGLAETLTEYVSFSPFFQTLISFESTYLMGNLILPLTQGADCPLWATYASIPVWKEGCQSPSEVKDAVCLFPWSKNDAAPGGRHMEFVGETDNLKQYWATGNQALIVRFVMTIFNYDYIVDYVFLVTGGFEIRVTPTGLIHVESLTFQTELPAALGQVLKSNPSYFAPPHVHAFHFKVDLDLWDQLLNDYRTRILQSPSESNKKKGFAFEVNETTMLRETSGLPLQGGGHQHLICKPTQVATEWPQCYRITNKAEVRNPIVSDKYSEAFSWSKHPFVVTKYKPSESSSSSVYNGVDLTQPHVRFQEFIQDNESIFNEDLVLWITIGGQHIPFAEDLPHTLTTANKFSILFHPNNFFKFGCDSEKTNFQTKIY